MPNTARSTARYTPNRPAVAATPAARVQGVFKVGNKGSIALFFPGNDVDGIYVHVSATSKAKVKRVPGEKFRANPRDWTKMDGTAVITLSQP